MITDCVLFAPIFMHWTRHGGDFKRSIFLEVNRIICFVVDFIGSGQFHQSLLSETSDLSGEVFLVCQGFPVSEVSDVPGFLLFFFRYRIRSGKLSRVRSTSLKSRAAWWSGDCLTPETNLLRIVKDLNSVITMFRS